MGFDELDDLLNPEDELEAAFRELDAKLKMDELRRKGPARKSTGTSRKGSAGARKSRTAGKGGAADPLRDLKAAFAGKAPAGRAKAKPKTKAKPKAKGPAKRYLVVVCPSCSGKNRVPLDRLRKSLPVCGRCKTDLSFERS